VPIIIYLKEDDAPIIKFVQTNIKIQSTIRYNRLNTGSSKFMHYRSNLINYESEGAMEELRLANVGCQLTAFRTPQEKNY